MGNPEQDAFVNIKAALCSDSVLRHYDSNADLVQQCDASSIGVGAALLQPSADSTLQPSADSTLQHVAYTSRLLSNAEQNYSQIKHESLAIIFGVIKFCQYLLGRHFKLLITLLGEDKPVPQLVSTRIKRWSLLLAAYNYTIELISGKDNVYADFLSMKPINGKPSPQEKVTVNFMFIEGDQIVNAKMVTQETKNDPNPITITDWNSPMKMEYYYGTLEWLYQDHYVPLSSKIYMPNN